LYLYHRDLENAFVYTQVNEFINFLEHLAMKTFMKFWPIILLLGFLSCEKKDSSIKYKSSSDYLSDKAILSIQLYDNNIWVYSTKVCDTCYVSPIMSSTPMISQLTLINNNGFDYEEPTLVSTPTMDHHGNLYTVSRNKMFKLIDIKNYELVFETKDFNFFDFAFDKNDNIWLAGDNGIAFWNGKELQIFNTSNSELPSNIIHGLDIDTSDNVWVALDFKGLLKINGDKWEIIPSTEIPGLSTYSYLNNPIVDNENNIWFNVFMPNTTSSFLKFTGKDWQYEYPNELGNGVLNIDSKGTIWAINSEYENSVFKRSTLTYLQNNEWVNFDVSTIKTKILTVNSDDRKVYIGTTEGLIVVEK